MKRFLQMMHAIFTLMCLLAFSTSHTAQAAATPWIDIQVVRGHLIVASEIGGIAGHSIIDTGAMSTAINGRFVKSAGLTLKRGRDVKVSGVVSTELRPSYRNVETVMFDTPLKFANVLDVNLGSPDTQLLIGADFLNGYVIQFDYPNERMRLISRDSIELKKLKNVKSKRSRDDGSILVRVLFDTDKKSWLTLDTGASGSILADRRLAHRMDWIGTYETEVNRIAGVISTTTLENFRIPSMQLGPFNIENVLVSIPMEGEKMVLFERETSGASRLMRRNAADGILGYEILKHFIVTVDYGKGYVHLSPGEKIAAD